MQAAKDNARKPPLSSNLLSTLDVYCFAILPIIAYILPATTRSSNRCVEILAKEHTYKLLAAELKNNKTASHKRKREQPLDDGGDEAMPEEDEADVPKGAKPKRKAKAKAKAAA